MKLTFAEASLLLAQNLSPRQRATIYLHAGDTATEVTSVTNPGSHTHVIVGGDLESTDSSSSYETVVDEELGNACPLVVGGTYKLPSARSHAMGDNRGGKSTIALDESSEECPWRYHPEVHPPASRVVIEDGSRSSVMLYPRQQSDGVSGVKFPSSVRELNVAV